MNDPSSRTSNTSSSPTSTRSTEIWPRASIGDAPHIIAGSTPQPHLPLRKASSEALRNGHSNPQRIPVKHFKINSDAISGKIHQLGALDENGSETTLPSTVYVPPKNNRQKGLIRFDAQLDPECASSSVGTKRSRSHSESPAVPNLPNHASLLRTATSIPDYRAINNAYKATASDSPQLERTVSVEKSPYSASGPTFWKDGGANTLRASIRSAMTDTSTHEWSGTERSSIWTEASTASEFNPNWPLIKEEEMNSEDVIGMYVEGFSDPKDDETPAFRHDPSPTSNRSPHEAQSAVLPQLAPIERSYTPSIAMSAPFPKRGSISLPPQPQIQASSHVVASGHIDHTHSVEDRLKALISVPRDRYGFKKASKDISNAQYDAWNTTYVKYLERRRKKWVALMKHCNLPIENPTRFPPRSEKVKRYIRKGIPPEWRGAAWFHYAGGPAILAKQAGVYDILLRRAHGGQLSEGDREHIERDLHRTYPDNIHFKPDSIPSMASSRPSTAVEGETPRNQSFNNSAPDTPMIRSLRNVLQAFAIHNPKIGYCQSLNFLAGYLLVFLSGDEEKAFHLLCILTSVHLPGTHGVALEGANIDIGVLMICVKETMPALWNKIDDRADATISLAAGDMRVSTGLPTVSLATTAWFMSCFASTLPTETTCRVWDALFYEGSKTLFRVGLAIFKIGEPDIRRVSEPMEAFQIVQTLPRKLLDANLVMDVATSKRRGTFGGVSIGNSKEGFGAVSQKIVEKRRDERRGLYRAERERVLKSPTEPAEGMADQQSKLKKMPSRVRLRRLKSIRSPSKH